MQINCDMSARSRTRLQLHMLQTVAMCTASACCQAARAETDSSTNDLLQDSIIPSRDLNLGPPEYDTGLLKTSIRSSVTVTVDRFKVRNGLMSRSVFSVPQHHALTSAILTGSAPGMGATQPGLLCLTLAQ